MNSNFQILLNESLGSNQKQEPTINQPSLTSFFFFNKKKTKKISPILQIFD